VLAKTSGAGVESLPGSEYNGSGNPADATLPAYVIPAGGATVTLTLVSRETGLTWKNFVFSTSKTLSSTELGALSYSTILP